jgi:thioredoxin 1
MEKLNVGDANFQKEIKECEGVSLVDFWAPWCGPCQMMTPVMEELAESYKGKAKIAKLNVDENPGISQEFEVMSIPSLIFFKDGKEVERLIGAHDKEEIIAKLEKLL